MGRRVFKLNAKWLDDILSKQSTQPMHPQCAHQGNNTTKDIHDDGHIINRSPIIATHAAHILSYLTFSNIRNIALVSPAVARAVLHQHSLVWMYRWHMAYGFISGAPPPMANAKKTVLIRRGRLLRMEQLYLSQICPVTSLRRYEQLMHQLRNVSAIHSGKSGITHRMRNKYERAIRVLGRNAEVYGVPSNDRIHAPYAEWECDLPECERRVHATTDCIRANCWQSYVVASPPSPRVRSDPRWIKWIHALDDRIRRKYIAASTHGTVIVGAATSRGFPPEEYGYYGV